MNPDHKVEAKNTMPGSPISFLEGQHSPVPKDKIMVAPPGKLIELPV